MTLVDALHSPSQDAARAAICTGDTVVLTLTSRRISFHAKRATVAKATAKYVTVGWLKFTRSGKQVGESKSQSVHYGLYALTPEVEAAMEVR